MTQLDQTIPNKPQQHSVFQQWLLVSAVMVYLGLFGFNSLTRLRRFSPDSMNYVDVARNIVNGRGITQSTLGYNQHHFAVTGEIPTPFVTQPPVYPLLIALTSRFAVAYPDAALLVSTVFYGLVLLATFLMMRAWYDEQAALLSVACILFYYPLLQVSSFAWSEPVGIAFCFAAYWLLAHARQASARQGQMVFLAGLVMGLAFSTRYAFLPAVPVSVLVLIEPRDWRRTIRNIALFGIGFALPAGLVLANNWLQTRTLTGPTPNPPVNSLMDDVHDVVRWTFGSYLGENNLPQQTLLVASLVVCGLVLVAQRRFWQVIHAVFIDEKRYLLWLWPLAYFVFMLGLRRRIYFEALDPRLIAPAGVMLALIWATLVSKVTTRSARYLIYPALALVALAIGREANVAITTSPTSFDQSIARSERLTWIAENTTDRDLIIGDATVDVPFFFDRTAAVCIYAYPQNDYLEYDQVMAYARRNCSKYEHMYLILRNHVYNRGELGWLRHFGPFVTDLVFERADKYPGIIPLERFSSSFIFEVQCR
jgi:hypothetical protein